MKKIPLSAALAICIAFTCSHANAQLFRIISNALSAKSTQCADFIAKQDAWTYRAACVSGLTEKAPAHSDNECLALCTEISEKWKRAEREESIKRERANAKRQIERYFSSNRDSDSWNARQACFTEDGAYKFDAEAMPADECVAVSQNALQPYIDARNERIRKIKEEEDFSLMQIDEKLRSGAIPDQSICMTMRTGAQFDSDFEKRCLTYRSDQKNAYLAARKIKPTDCQEQAQYDGAEKKLSPISPTIVSMSSQGVSGYFVGRVQSIEGRRLTARDGTTNRIFILDVDKSAVLFASQLIAVGAVVRGYGEQVASTQATLASGARTTLAVIRAACIGPSSNAIDLSYQ